MSVQPITECRAGGQVADLMTPRPVTVSPGHRVGEVFELMTERRIRHLPVVDEDGNLCGIISQRDVLAIARTGGGPLSEASWGDARIADVMHEEIDTVSSGCCGGAAARHMLKTKRSSLPVVDEKGNLIGILTEADFLRLAARQWPACTCGGIERGG